MIPTTADIIKCFLYLIVGIFLIIKCIHKVPSKMSDEWLDKNK